MQQFSSVDEMMAHYKAVRERVNNWRPPPPPPELEVVPEPEAEPEVVAVVSEPEPAPEPVIPTMKVIRIAVCNFYAVSELDMLSARREKRICRPRQIAMYLCKTLTLHSLPKVGSELNRDHTTVLHAVRKIERLIETDPKLAEDIAALRKIIEGA